MNAQDKKDLKKIVKETLLEFWDDVLEPVLDKLHIKTDRVEGKIDTIEKEVKDLSQTMEGVRDRVDDIDTKVICQKCWDSVIEFLRKKAKSQKKKG